MKDRIEVGQQHAQRLHDEAFVWDYHVCLPLTTESRWPEELARYRRCGVDMIALNIGDSDAPLAKQIEIAAFFRHWLRSRPESYALILTADDIAQAKRAGKLAVCFNIEGAAAIGNQLSLVSLFYDLGVRWMLMAYNNANNVGSGCHDADDRGLTAFGYQLIAEMDRVGMIKDCSHTGYRTARDVLEASALPVTFSHSNARAIKDHPRNIPDDLIKACAATGGVVGICGVGIFLGDNDSSVAAMVRHIDHVAQLVGCAHVGLGTDYVFNQDDLNHSLRTKPGIWPEQYGYRPGINFFAPEKLPRLTDELLKRGYSDADVRAILGENFLRVAKQIWK